MGLIITDNDMVVLKIVSSGDILRPKLKKIVKLSIGSMHFSLKRLESNGFLISTELNKVGGPHLLKITERGKLQLKIENGK